MSLKLKSKKTLNITLLALFILGVNSIAQAEKGRKGPPKGKPPETAFIACASQTENSACSFKNEEDKTIEGICIVPRKNGEQLVCKSIRGKKKGRHRKSQD